MKICANCFRDEEIKSFINSESKEKGKCDYCLEESSLLDIKELLDFFSGYMRIFNEDPSGVRLMELIQSDWSLFVNDATGTLVLRDILSFLSSPLSPETIVSYLPEIKECVSYWETLKKELKGKTRFLTSIEQLQEYQWDSLLCVFSEIDKSFIFYRARINSNGENRPISIGEMGCPPQHLATEGRANPYGIPYLYLCKHLETTLYETRSLYLDILSIATFKVKDGVLKLVDFTNNQSPLNYDDMIQQTKGRLLRKAISNDLSKPMRRFDSILEYIPTQFICEYIRYNTGADGIQFNSSLHKEGVNVVIFDGAKMECLTVDAFQIESVKIVSRILGR